MRASQPRAPTMVGACIAVILGTASATESGSPSPTGSTPDADLLLVVDCLLPGQVRTLGQRTTYVSARRPARITARDCQIRGGEYVTADRADLRSALAAWLPAAERGDVDAQVIVGEIYERGLGVPPDPATAAKWYREAAKKNDRRAQINLGHLYERGLGVTADPRAALDWYRRAAGRDVPIDLDADVPAQVIAPAAPVAPDRSGEIEALQHELAQRTRENESIALELARSREENERARADLDARATEATRATQQARHAAEAALAAERRKLDDATRELTKRDAALASGQREALRLQTDLSLAQRDRDTARALAAQREAELRRLEKPVAEKLVAGPALSLIEPKLIKTRDIVPVARTLTAQPQLVGRVTAPAGLVSLTINDLPVAPNDLGVFSLQAPAAGAGPANSRIRIVAVDRQGKRSELEFGLERATATPTGTGAAAGLTSAAPRASTPAIDFGTYHALIIGNNDYQTLPDLSSPINDANDLATLLQSQYGFRTTVLTNASRYQILSALNRLRETLTSRDNLLIYFAGHGELDEVNQRGHWLPVDAERDSTANWIPTTAVTDILNIMQAKQILLVVDSCYAGALTRSSVGRLAAGMTSAEREHWLRTMSTRRSRTVLTSGGVAPVMDAGGGRHSVFAKALLEVLDGNADILDGQKLHREVAARVAFAAANLRFDQVPEYAPIRFAGHEAGEFFLNPAR